jgi:hypothetical protein
LPLVITPYANARPAVNPYHVVPESLVVNTNTSFAEAVAVRVGAAPEGQSTLVGQVTV